MERQKYRISFRKFLEFYKGCVCASPRTYTTGRKLVTTYKDYCYDDICKKITFDFEPGPVNVQIKRWIPSQSYTSFENAVRNKDTNAYKNLDSFMWRTATFDEFGTVCRAIFTAPMTGEFTFWMLVNEFGKFYFGTDETEASKIFRMGGEFIGSFGESEEKNVKFTMWLEKGKKYFAEAVTYDYSGDDYLYIFMAQPGSQSREPMSFEYLEPYTG
eukprot:TCONS_00025180-protein